MRLLYTDQLGSIVTVSDNLGNKIAAQNFDAWGRNRTPSDYSFPWTPPSGFPSFLYRGYCGHEMLPEFGLINMNGRMYDPLLGRMLSPDNNVADATSTQAYNRYSYVTNNPLKYTDPTGWAEYDVYDNGNENGNSPWGPYGPSGSFFGSYGGPAWSVGELIGVANGTQMDWDGNGLSFDGSISGNTVAPKGIGEQTQDGSNNAPVYGPSTPVPANYVYVDPPGITLPEVVYIGDATTKEIADEINQSMPGYTPSLAGIFQQVWDSRAGRSFTGDFYQRGLKIDATYYTIGVSYSLDINWQLHGTGASLIPFFSQTGGAAFGSPGLSLTATSTSYDYTGPVVKLNQGVMSNNSVAGTDDPAYSLSVGGGEGMVVGASLSYWNQKTTGYSLNGIGTYGGIGIGTGISINGAVTNTLLFNH